MPVTTSHNHPISIPALLFYCHSLSCLPTVQAISPVPSPEASIDLICHTQHASECYPAVFQPTEHFQPIHHDQSLPPGLHVRLNLATGYKEARLNVPEPSGTKAVELVIVDDLPSPSRKETVEEATEDAPIEGIHDQSHPNRDYPYIPSHFSAEESALFASSTYTVRSSSASSAPEAFLSALESLTELCHDYHWGLTLTRDAELVARLIQTINFQVEASTELRSHAALLLGASIQNNPDALAALLSNSNSDDPRQTPMQVVLVTLNESVKEKGDPTLHRRTIFLLSQLVNDPSQLKQLLMSNGLDVLLKLFNVDTLATRSSDHPAFVGDGRDKLRAKIANLMCDHVLPALESDEAQQLASQVIFHSGAEGIGDGDSDLVRLLEPWNRALGTMLEKYAVFFVGKEGREAPVEYGAYQSISEATGLLKKVVKIP